MRGTQIRILHFSNETDRLNHTCDLHSSEDVDYGLLSCAALWACGWFASVSEERINPEHGSDTFFRNSGKHVLDYAASQLRRPQSADYVEVLQNSE
jgi:hypothetical protein